MFFFFWAISANRSSTGYAPGSHDDDHAVRTCSLAKQWLEKREKQREIQSELSYRDGKYWNRPKLPCLLESRRSKESPRKISMSNNWSNTFADQVSRKYCNRLLFLEAFLKLAPSLRYISLYKHKTTETSFTLVPLLTLSLCTKFIICKLISSTSQNFKLGTIVQFRQNIILFHLDLSTRFLS